MILSSWGKWLTLAVLVAAAGVFAASMFYYFNIDTDDTFPLVSYSAQYLNLIEPYEGLAATAFAIPSIVFLIVIIVISIYGWKM